MGRQAKRRRQEKEVTRTPNWLELPLDLLRCVFQQLSFTSLNQAKLVCSSWYSVSRGCVPKNQIPWLILLPRKETNGRCAFFDPEDRKKVYRTRGLGVEFAQSDCLTTCGSWFLLLNDVRNLYILNPLTRERINLPETRKYFQSAVLEIACFWIDNKTKDYLVVVVTSNSQKFVKKGYKSWQYIRLRRRCEDVFYNDKIQKLFVHYPNNREKRFVHIWDFSADNPHRNKIVHLPSFHFNLKDFSSFLEKDRGSWSWRSLSFKSRIAVTVSGDFLMVSYVVHPWKKTWCFRIYKINMENKKWVPIDSLGDEALIYDMGITVVANRSIPGIKRNSIYLGSRGSEDPTNVFVYDLTTQKVEPLPQCVLSCIPFYSEARWFLPY